MPLWLLWEAKRRKRKHGHAMPLRALKDAQNAQISDTARLKEQEQARLEEKGQNEEHVEDLRPMNGQEKV